VEEVMDLASYPKTAFEKASDCSYETIDSALKHVSMSEYKYKLFRDLSGGQQQRVLIAKALVSNPEILILDEPTVGIDIIAQRHLYTLLEHLNKHHKITVILISHDTQFLDGEHIRVWYVGKMDCDECHNEKIHLFQIKKMFPKNTVEYLY
jgi:zinc transport system ATP-binding protein